MSAWLTLIGIGEDGHAGLGDAARRALAEARLIMGAPRQLALLPESLKAERQHWPSPFSLAPVLARRGQPTCVLASGDPMLHGVGASLARQLPAAELRVLPAPSSASLAAARLGWPLQDCQLLSLLSAPVEQLLRHAHQGQRLLLLSRDAQTPAEVAACLTAAGFGGSRLSLLEHLGGPLERRIDGQACDWQQAPGADLNLLAVECRRDPQLPPLAQSSGLRDDAFRHDGQLTKRDLRAITLARLAPCPGERLWDVGAGCGSIAIEWLRSDSRCSAIAIEADPGRQALIRHNSAALGVPQLQLVCGRAPTALAGLPTPQAIFIGGGVTCDGLLEQCWQALASGGRLVANAVTLQSAATLLAFRAQHGGELLQIQIARAQPLGRFDSWRSALPITLLEVHKP